MTSTRRQRYATLGFLVVAAPVVMALTIRDNDPDAALLGPAGLVLIAAVATALLLEAAYRVAPLGRREVLLEAQNEVDSVKALIEMWAGDWDDAQQAEHEALARGDREELEEARDKLADLRRERVDLDNRLGRARRQRDYSAADLRTAERRARRLLSNRP